MYTLENRGSLTAVLMEYHAKEDAGIYFDRGGDTPDYLSYAALIRISFRMGEVLTSGGMCPGDELVMQVEDSKLFICIFWACLIKGIIPVPLAVGTQEDYKHKVWQVWKQLANPYIICSPRQQEYLENYLAEQEPAMTAAFQGRAFTGLQPETFDAVTPVPLNDIATEGIQDQLAFIQFSSGSTGNPKGISLTHCNVLHNIAAMLRRMKITVADRMLSWVPLTHDMGLILAHLMSTMAGIDQYIVPTDAFRRRPLQWMQKVSRYRASILYTNNFGLKYFISLFDDAHLYDWDLSCIRIIFNGGEPVSAEVANIFLEKLAPFGLQRGTMLPCYGMAEASVGATFCEPGTGMTYHRMDRNYLNTGDKVQFLQPTDAAGSTLVEVGAVLDNLQLRIIDDKDQELPDEHIGYICMKGPNVTKGYYRNEAATVSAFLEQEWLRTGDVGFIRNGRLVVTGRAKNIIIINGRNYYPSDIEAIAEGASQLDRPVVIACGVTPAEDLLEQLLIFVVFRGALSEFIPVAAAIKKAIWEQAGLNVLHVIPLKKVPKTTSGKVQYFRLRESFLSGAFDDMLLSSGTKEDKGDIQTTLLKKVRHMLADDTLTADDLLFSGGINSLLIMQLAGFIQAIYEVRLPVQDFFGDLTIAAIAAKITTAIPRREKVSVLTSASSGSWPLSHAQKGLWYIHHEREHHNTAYNNVLAFGIKGTLNVAALVTAQRQLITRYEILRTRFAVTDVGPVQEIMDVADSPFFFEHRVLPDETDIRHIADSLIRQENDYGFDLGKDALMRTHLLSKSGTIHYLILNIHHIITDAWSVKLLLNELTIHYNAVMRGEQVGQTCFFPQYKDYVAWQQQWLADIEGQQAAEYWQQKLAYAASGWNITGTKARPEFKTYDGAMISRQLDVNQHTQIQAFCKAHQVSPFMLLLATVKLLLYKYTGEEDLVIGTPAYGRAGFQDQPGLFINMLPLRTQLSANDSFFVLLKDIRHTCLEAYEYQQYPFELILQDLRLARDSSRSPLFDIMVEYNHTQLLADQLLLWEGAAVTMQPRIIKHSLYDLSFEFDQQPDGLVLKLHYNTDIFDEPLVSQLLSHFFTLLTAVHRQPEKPLYTFSYISVDEQAQLLQYCKGPVRNYDLSGSYISYFERHLPAWKDRVAVAYNGTTYTFAEVDEISGRIASYLRTQWNVTEDVCVAILLNRSPEFLWWVLGIWKAGGAYVPVDPALPVARIRYMLDCSEARCLLITDDELLRHPDIAGSSLTDKSVNITAVQDTLQQHPFLQPAADNPVALAYVLFTSGSTGAPKGVMITHRGMLNHMFGFIEYLQIDEDSRIAQNASQSFDISVWQFFTTLLTGGTVYIYDQQLVYQPGSFAQRLAEDRISVLEVVPSYLKLLLDEGWLSDTTDVALESLLVTGEEIRPGLALRALALLPDTIRLINAYGPAEASDDVTLHHITAANIASEVPIGKPMPNNNVYVIDRAGNLCAPYVRGEIAVSGTGVGRGYINNETLTQAVFTTDPHEPGTILYHTGDIGYMDRDGHYYFLWRRDNQVKVRGYRIELGEIEKVLMTVAGVTEAVVLAKNAQDTGMSLIAFTAGTAEQDTARLKSAVAAALPAYMMPVCFIHPQEWPLNNNGKTDRKALLALAGNITVTVDTAASDMGPLEHRLAALWSAVLSVPAEISMYSNFFVLGGHSLSAMQLIQRIRKEWNVQLSLSIVFRQQTLEAMANGIRNARQQAAADIPLLPEQEDYAVATEQTRFLITNELDQGNYTNNAVGGICIEGHLNIERFKKAARLLPERHEILRSVIRKKGFEYRFYIQPSTEEATDIQYTDISNNAAIDEVLADIARKEATHVFDVSSLPLIRWHLVKKGHASYVLLVTLHHVIADGGSLVVLLKDVLQLYQSPEEDPVLLRTRIQYKDYVAWHEEQQDVHTRNTFWKNYLAMPLPVTSLPVDLPRNNERLHPAASLVFNLEPALIQDVKVMATNIGVTPFMLLLAGVHVLLYKYSSHESYMIAIPVADRDHPQLQDQVGLYFKLLLLRVAMAGDMSFRQLADVIQSDMIRIMDHPCSYDHYTEQLQLSRPGRTGLYDVMVMHQAVDLGPMPCGLQVYPYLERMFDDKTDCDLRFDFIEYNGTITVAVNYNVSLFRQATIQLLQYRLLSLLRQLLSNNGQISLNEVNPDAAAANTDSAGNSNSTMFTADFQF
ncbi:non-ribosomal peptide synthetase [Chitinophaga pendula]|uniref:non-ribosomal peptide synthetase n=1 Tax=Chitinophaga TaxID=79328 RepID=UPI000BAEE849|nr:MULTISPECIES: non-ribosomal peptide synthetase [Chitinophaga]ASZ09483.1 hypothetical protein CK934_00060 [Chitinophaga sp. MD30]UCJ07587.1 non-ribosomal peptide synthetase [Chitinophaga pendula]